MTDRWGAEWRKLYGFLVCPQCGTRHTTHTVTCRECDFQVTPRVSYEDFCKIKKND